MKIIAFTGLPFSGKSEAVHIAKKYNIPVIRMGDFVWEETRRQGKKLNDTNVGSVANEMRKKEGMDVWAQRTVHAINNLESADIIVIDGVRNQEEITFFKQQLGADFILIAIVASDAIREQRAQHRGRVDDSTNQKKFNERDQRERQWGLEKIINKAEIKINNNGTLESFHHEIKILLHTIVAKR